MEGSLKMKETTMIDVKQMCELTQIYDIGMSVRFFDDRIGIEVSKRDPDTKRYFNQNMAVSLTKLEDGTFDVEAYANYMANILCETIQKSVKRRDDG